MRTSGRTGAGEWPARPGAERHPDGLLAPVGNPVFYDFTSTRIASSTRSTGHPINSSSFTVNTLAYHLQASDCGVTVSGSVSAGDVFSGATVQTPSFTLNGSNSQSFVVLQPLNSDFHVQLFGVVEVIVLTLTTAMGSVTVYGTSFLQFALLNCPAGTFGVQTSAIVASSAYSLGPTIPAACTEATGNPLVDDGTSYTLPPYGVAQQAFSVDAGHTANAMAVHVLGNYTVSGGSVFLGYNGGGDSDATPYLPQGNIVGVYAAPLASMTSFSVPSSVTLLVIGGGQNDPVTIGGSSTAPQVQLLSCQPSAFTAQGGSVPAVVCPVSSSSAVSSSVRSSSALSSTALSSSRVSSSAVSSSVFSSSALSSSAPSSSARSSSALSSSAVSSSPMSSSLLFSSAVSSSAVSSSALSSSAVSSSAASSSAVSSSSSSSTSAAAFSDPRFRGFWGQSFYVEGVVGGVYSLLSSQAVQVNARFTYRSIVSCPQVDGHDVSNCFQEAGTYFGSLAVRASTGDWLRVVGGGVADGFAEVSINGQRAVQVGDVVNIAEHGDAHTTTATSSSPRAGLQLQRLRRLLRGVAAGGGAQSQPSALRSTHTATHHTEAATDYSALPTSLPTLTVTRLSARQLRVQAGDYTLHIDNMDGYVDLSAVDVQCWACLEQGHLSLDGLLGQTWNSSARMVHDEEGVEQFRVQGDDEAGCSSAMHDRHCAAA